MQNVPQITYRHVQHSPALEEAVYGRVDYIKEQHPNISVCRVVIEKPHQHHKTPSPYHIRINAVINGQNLLVGTTHSKSHTNDNAYTAVNGAFDALEKQVEKAKAHYRSFYRAIERKHHLSNVPLREIDPDTEMDGEILPSYV